MRPSNVTLPFTWSYSALSAYEKCPAKIRYKREGFKPPKNKYLERGIAVHEAGEAFLKSPHRRNPPEDYAKNFNVPMLKLRGYNPIAEGEVALTRAWEPTGWFGPQTWFRAKIDARYVDPQQDDLMHVVDFKTGRPRPSYQLQDLCYTVATFAKHPEIERVRLEFWYLDHGVVLGPKKELRRKNVFEGGKRELTVRAARFENERGWKEAPGAHCQYCDYSQRKGGPCKY